VANIFNSLRNSVTLATYVPVTDLMDQDADLNFMRTRYCNSSVFTLAPGTNVVPDAFWSAWTSANPTSTLLTNHILFPS
jgi:hypothetical protein